MTEDSREMSKQNWTKELKPLSIKHIFFPFFFFFFSESLSVISVLVANLGFGLG